MTSNLGPLTFHDQYPQKAIKADTAMKFFFNTVLNKYKSQGSAAVAASAIATVIIERKHHPLKASLSSSTRSLYQSVSSAINHL